jgi:hypothetical protein
MALKRFIDMHVAYVTERTTDYGEPVIASGTISSFKIKDNRVVLIRLLLHEGCSIVGKETTVIKPSQLVDPTLKQYFELFNKQQTKAIDECASLMQKDETCMCSIKLIDPTQQLIYDGKTLTITF